MRETNSWRLASPEELANYASPNPRPTTAGLLVTRATQVLVAGPLMACNFGMDDVYGGADWTDESGDGTSDEWGDGDGDGDGDTAVDPCAPLPPPFGAIIEVGPDQASQLPAIVAQAGPDTTILLADGYYDLSGGQPLWLLQPGVVVRSKSGVREAVVLDGGYVLDRLVVVAASGTAVANLTLERARSTAIHMTGAVDSDTSEACAIDVVIRDPGQRGIVIEASDTGTRSDVGIIACSTIELTDAGRERLDGCDIGGIEGRGADGWTIQNNLVTGFWCEDGLADAAIGLADGSRGTTVERNVIEDSALGIQIGAGELPSGEERSYFDQACPEVELPSHIDGIVRNNSVWAGSSELFASTEGVHAGIALERACGAAVHHNTVVTLKRPLGSIVASFPDTDATFINNLVTHGIATLDGATAVRLGNIDDASLTGFVQPTIGDVHLLPSSEAVGAGADLSYGIVDDDIDGEWRDFPRDVGADQIED